MADALSLAVLALLSDRLAKIEARPAPVDGVSPDAGEIVDAVLAKLPAPVDGVSPDVDEVVEAVLAKLPAPVDGVSPDAGEIVEAVLAKLPAPVDGVSPDVDEIINAVLAKIPVPKNGVSPKAAKNGEPGPRGPAPAHRWRGTKLSFQKPDGTWGKEVDLKGKDGTGRGGTTVFTTTASSGPAPVPQTNSSYFPGGW